MCLSFTFSLVRKPGSTSEDPFNLDSDDESSLSQGGHAQVPINLDLDDALVTTFSTVATSTAAASTTSASAAVASTTAATQSSPADIIRKVSMQIEHTMSLHGLWILIFCSEAIERDCPKARSGGASLAAALVLQVPEIDLRDWMRAAENLFSREVHLVWQHVTRPETFQEWLIAARHTGLSHVPADPSGDTMLAARMCSKEHWLLGYDPRISQARPNGPAMELLRWLLRGMPRPQLAFCFLKVKHLFQEAGELTDSDLPASWAAQWESRAAQVSSERFFWVGQGGDHTPSDVPSVRAAKAAHTYVLTVRSCLRCAFPDASTATKECKGPSGGLYSMCRSCRAEPTARLRDHCLAKSLPGGAKMGCVSYRLCSTCKGVDHRLVEGARKRPDLSELCPGGCLGLDGNRRKVHACAMGFSRRKNDVKAQQDWCIWRTTSYLPAKPGRKKRALEEDEQE